MAPILDATVLLVAVECTNYIMPLTTFVWGAHLRVITEKEQTLKLAVMRCGESKTNRWEGKD